MTNRTLLRPGMGVVIDPPLSERVKVQSLQTWMFGSIVAIETDLNKPTCGLLLSRDYMLEYVLGNLGQTSWLRQTHCEN